MVKKMKKIANIFYKIGLSIYGILEKNLILPISKIIHSFTNKFDKTGKNFENFLSRQTTLLFISLFLAFIIFVTIDRKIIVFSENSAEIVKGEKVSVIYNEEAYVLEGIPESVDVTLIGRRADLIFAKQASDHEIKIDLTGLKPGTHRVNINYKQSMPSVKYIVNPSVATIVIHEKKSIVKNLSIDLLNKEKLSPKLIITDVKTLVDEVIIKGSEQELEKVSTVKALVDINNMVEFKTGVSTIRNVPLVAYDNLGKIVNVEIVPNRTDATITIESPSKEVALKIVPQGELSFGSAISQITASETKVTLYGTNEALEKINSIEVPIDVKGLKQDREYKIELSKPTGIRTMSVNNLTVNIKVDESVDREISGINIEYKNLDEKYAVQGLSAEDVSVVVGLKGVKSVVDNIAVEDISAYLNLGGYLPGEHEVNVVVEGNDLRINYIAKTVKVKIRIIKK